MRRISTPHKPQAVPEAGVQATLPAEPPLRVAMRPVRPAMRENTSKILVAYLYGLRIFEWSGWQDSNLRHPGSRPGTLAQLSYTQSNCQDLRPCQNFA